MKQKLAAEALGTFILVFCGTGACVVDALTGQITHVGIALTFGLVVMALIYAFGPISGAHLNPAVSIAFALNRTIGWRTCGYYVLVQCAGAIAASTMLWLLFGQTGHLGATIPAGSVTQSFVLEFVLTFILMLVICYAALHPGSQGGYAGLAIGATVGLEAMFGGPVSGASMNPARSLGPALLSGHLEPLWIYVLATIGGAVCAMLVYRFFQQKT